MEIRVGVVCDRGLNPKRPVNQDSYLSVPAHGLFAVFDGVGGQKAGEVASRMAAETIEESLANINASTSHDLINRAITFANRDIYERAEGDPAYQTMATTVALAHVEGNRVTLAHVGDSRVYRLEDGYLYRETIDHTDHNDALRAGVAPGVAGGSGNVINRALGVEPDVEVEIKSIVVTDGTRLLLCSDGVYRHLADEEIASVLAQTKDPQAAADELKRLVLSRGADDNLTAIVVQLGRARLGNVMGVDDGLSGRLDRQGAGARAINTRRAAAGPSSQSTASSPAAVSRATPNNRIEVAFKHESTDDGSPWDWQGNGAEVTGAGAPGGKSRTLLWVLTLLVLGAAAFYVGLRASEWFGGGSSNPPAPVSTTERIKAAREEFEKGNRAAAAAEFERLVSSEPQNAEARFWLGRAYLEQGDYAKARENFDEAIKTQPRTPDVYLYAAAAQKALGERARADAMLEKYVELRKAQVSTQQPTVQAPNR